LSRDSSFLLDKGRRKRFKSPHSQGTTRRNARFEWISPRETRTPRPDSSRFRNQNGKCFFFVEKSDLERQFDGPLSGSSSRGLDGGEMGRRESVVDLGGGGAVKTLMRPVTCIVGQAESNSSLELFQHERLENTYAGDALEGSPKTFYQSDGAGFSDGSEALPNVEVFEEVSEGFGGELRALVGYKVSGDTEALYGFAEELDHGLGGRFGEKDADCQRHSRENVNDCRA
jgi:hypothetical protein